MTCSLYPYCLNRHGLQCLIPVMCTSIELTSVLMPFALKCLDPPSAGAQDWHRSDSSNPKQDSNPQPSGCRATWACMDKWFTLGVHGESVRAEESGTAKRSDTGLCGPAPELGVGGGCSEREQRHPFRLRARIRCTFKRQSACLACAPPGDRQTDRNMARMPGSGDRDADTGGTEPGHVGSDGEDDIQEVQITGDEEEEDDDDDEDEDDEDAGLEWEAESVEPGAESEAILARGTERRGALRAAPERLHVPGPDSEAEAELHRADRSRLSENTRLATRYAVRIFREYLSEKSQSPDFESMDKEALCAVLRSFYAEARSKSGQLYSKSANLTLAAVIRKLEEQGAGPVVQKQAITRGDLRKLYTSSVFNTSTPFGLLNKVWFETCMYFCTRGRENQRELEEDSFGLAVDEDGRKFIYFKALGPYHKSRSASWSKRRSDGDEDSLPRMYETGTEFCPYASFVKYVSKRNPLCRAFFQRPRDHCGDADSTWYENKAIGKNLLGTRMQMLSRAAKLSKTYTNHCIGAVSVATLNGIAGIGSKWAPLRVAPETVGDGTELRFNLALPAFASPLDGGAGADVKAHKASKRPRPAQPPAPEEMSGAASPKKVCVGAAERAEREPAADSVSVGRAAPPPGASPAAQSTRVDVQSAEEVSGLHAVLTVCAVSPRPRPVFPLHCTTAGLWGRAPRLHGSGRVRCELSR
ncbi:hypothetical protein Z043_118241 [Scleropages formosus]|uniref:ZMYM2-like/QRICH1 C-terminal domain-containing protein n=1 Tax=Scleropages formosus TaxID=113540 RepID=A0A0P7UUS0_SCLFO|nr:hypothetical protein Z043_118241 [Scleropages formosus]